MKVKGIFMLLLLAVIVFSCKETLEPTLIITVQDTTGAVIENATVRTHPCFEPNGSCQPADVNINFVKQAQTNGAGQVSFKFPYSAIIEVDGQWSGGPCDTVNPVGPWCIFHGRTVAQFESQKVDKGDVNEYNVVVIITPEY